MSFSVDLISLRLSDGKVPAERSVQGKQVPWKGLVSACLANLFKLISLPKLARTSYTKSYGSSLFDSITKQKNLPWLLYTTFPSFFLDGNGFRSFQASEGGWGVQRLNLDVRV